MPETPQHEARATRRPVFHKPTLIIDLAISGILIFSMWMNVHLTAIDAARAQGRATLTALSQAVTQCTAATEAMTQVVQANNGTVTTFDQMASSLTDNGAPISSVQLAPDGVVTDIYPAQGNEAGKIDLFADPDRRDEAILARDSGQTIVAGPFELKQGGDILATANIGSLAELGYRYELTANVDGETVHVSGQTDTAGMTSVTQEIYGKDWTLWVTPHIWPQTAALTVAGSLMLIILSLLLSALYQQTRTLDRQRVTDGLTGLLNRRGFDLAMERTGGDKGLRQLVLIAIDLNNFKSFNDIYGHDNGDVLLRSFAAELRELVGKGGKVARNGGDEFQIFLKDPADGWEAAYRDFFERQHFFIYHGKRYEYLLSAGYVVYPDQGDNMRELYRKADTALYHAKSDPNSRFCQYEETMSREPREQLGFNFKNLTEGAPAAVLIYRDDPSRQILYANEKCIRLFDCDSLGDFLTLTRDSFRTLVHPDDAQWAEAAIERQQANPGYQHVDYLVHRVTCKDGTVKEVYDIGRRFRHEHYGDVYIVFLMDEALGDRFERKV